MYDIMRRGVTSYCHNDAILGGGAKHYLALCLTACDKNHDYYWRMCSGVTSQQQYLLSMSYRRDESEHAKHNIPDSIVKQRLLIKTRIPHLSRIGSCRNYTGDGVFIASTACLKNVLVTTRHSTVPRPRTVM